MNAITFSLVPVPEEIAAGRKVYRAYVKTNGTIAAQATVSVTMKSHGGVPESEEQTVSVDAVTYAPPL